MTLPVPPNPISLNQVNVELGLAGTTLISLNQASVRTLAGVPSGVISLNNLYGKSNRVTLTVNYTTSTANASIGLTSLPGYIAGKTDLVVNVSAGVYVYGSNNGFPGLSIYAYNTSDTVTVNNSGYILGGGGGGGNGGATFTSGYNGIEALSIFTTSTPLVVNNAAGAYIAGGGGGGGGGTRSGGGGGAGGGAGGDVSDGAGNSAAGGAGGSIGASGVSGVQISGGLAYWSGGGGGRVLPGATTGMITPIGVGGTAGGGGGGGTNIIGNPLPGGSGGGPTQAGFPYNPSTTDKSGAGGGGWGAAGGAGPYGAVGGLAGAAIKRAGTAGPITVNNSGNIYGAVI